VIRNRISVDLLTETIPVTAKTVLAVKLAVAEKHIFFLQDHPLASFH